MAVSWAAVHLGDWSLYLGIINPAEWKLRNFSDSKVREDALMGREISDESLEILQGGFATNALFGSVSVAASPFLNWSINRTFLGIASSECTLEHSTAG